MRQVIDSSIEFLKQLVETNNPFVGVFMGFFVIVLESILPILPLAVFIALNMIVFGNVFGFIMSWIATTIGCILAFTICRKGFSNRLYRFIKKKNKLEKLMNNISNIKFTNLVLITALPFTPAFSINIAAGLSKISYRKFIAAIIIAKLVVVYFWGFIGTTLLESITDIKVILRIIVLMVIVYLVSRIINKKFNIEG
ncbi:MAG: VTT domain-containing protein [Bacilli bacterium]